MQERFSKKVHLTQVNQLNQKWFNGLEEDQREEFAKRLIQNQDILAAFANIIQQKLDANAKARRSRSAYDKPAWSEFQADTIGYERLGEELLPYLNINNGDK